MHTVRTTSEGSIPFQDPVLHRIRVLVNDISITRNTLLSLTLSPLGVRCTCTHPWRALWKGRLRNRYSVAIALHAHGALLCVCFFALRRTRRSTDTNHRK